MYNPNIPLGNQNLSVSRGQIETNFQQINAIFGTNVGADHYAFDDATSANRGLHKQVTYPAVKGADPVVVAPAGETYTKTISAVTELFYSNATQVTQITSGGLPIWKGGPSGSAGVVFLSNASTSASNRLLLPNGVCFIWGSFNPNSSVNVTFPGGGFPNNCINIQLTGSADNNSTFRIGVSTGTLTQTGFTFEGSVSSHWNPIYYFAIGY